MTDDRSLEQQVRDEIDALNSDHPFVDSLTALALSLARGMDTGEATGPSVVRELRATLTDLKGAGGGDSADSDLEDLSAPI